MPRFPRRAAAALLLAAAACMGATEPGAMTFDARGSWSYTATPTPSDGTTLSGTVTITQQRGSQFSGDFDVVETDGLGNAERLTGPLSGAAADSAHFDFDLVIYGAPRRHLAVRAGERMDGDWYDQGNGAAVGTFTMTRRATP